jgi:hypothetical protein
VFAACQLHSSAHNAEHVVNKLMRLETTLAAPLISVHHDKQSYKKASTATVQDCMRLAGPLCSAQHMRGKQTPYPSTM